MRFKISGAVAKRTFLIILALAVSGSSAFGLRSWASQYQEFERALVASRDIPSYSVITSDDIGWKNVPVGSVDTEAVQDPKEVINKMTVAPLYKGEQIRPERLGDSPLMIGPGEVSIGIPVDALKAVGMTVGPGDIVDVLWVTGPEVPAQRVAANATVLDIKNKDANSVVGQIRSALDANTSNQAQDNTPDIAVLKILHEEAPNVARALSSGMLVLIKKEGGVTGGKAVS